LPYIHKIAILKIEPKCPLNFAGNSAKNPGIQCRDFEMSIISEEAIFQSETPSVAILYTTNL
jgi:hypothetical protein